MKNKNLKNILQIALAIFFVFILTNKVMGGWNPKPTSAPKSNPVEPLNVLDNQIKEGGLFLNYDTSNVSTGTAQSGLIVFGDPPNAQNGDPGTGLVGVGTLTPTQKLDLVGNVLIEKGVLIANDTVGNWTSGDSVLRKYSDGYMYWGPPVAWTTLTSDINSSNTCNGLSVPETCSTIGYNEYFPTSDPNSNVVCLTDPSNHSFYVRNCYK